MERSAHTFQWLTRFGPPDGDRAPPALVRSLVVAAMVAVGVDCGVFVLASGAGLGLEPAQALAFAAAFASAAMVCVRSSARACVTQVPLALLLVVAILAFALRAGVLSLLVGVGAPSALAIAPAAIAAAVVGCAGMLFILAGSGAEGTDATERWASVAVLTIVYLLAVRLVYVGQLELTPQESYYWNFAQHLDLGYLDHPPMVAWLIAAATLPGNAEWLVRLPAIVCSLVTVAFVAALGLELAGAGNAFRTALLAAVLPYFFGVGVLVTPDAPLTAAWAAALYFLSRALLRTQRQAWIGAGIAIGLGMLSKYTMILVPLAAFVFVLVDRQARRTLLTSWPWMGAIIACLVFSPVVVWNMQHDWASFAFQGSRRLEPEARRFGLHLFVLFLFAVVTPWGIAGFVRGVARARSVLRASPEGGGAAGGDLVTGRALRFAIVFTVVPLVPLAVTSVWTETKIHWTGPIWLAALPVIAAGMVAPRAGGTRSRFDRALARSWPSLLHVLLVAYVIALFYYPVYGLAGVHAHHRYVETGWRDLREQVQSIEDEVARENGARPAIVGLDKHNMASQMAYYDPRGDGPSDTASRSIVTDADALMYGFWFSPRDFAGRDLILVSCDRGAIEDPAFAPQARRLGLVRTITVRKQGVATRECYARVLYGFTPARRAGST
jgi:dolichol-phosphate mannosyltransferase